MLFMKPFCSFKKLEKTYIRLLSQYYYLFLQTKKICIETTFYLLQNFPHSDLKIHLYCVFAQSYRNR